MEEQEKLVNKLNSSIAPHQDFYLFILSFNKKKNPNNPQHTTLLLDKERYCPVSFNTVFHVCVKNSTQKHLKMDKALGKAFASRDEGYMQVLKRISMGMTRLV